MTDTKKCAGPCKQQLPLSCFGRDVTRADGIRTACKECVAHLSREYRKRKRLEREAAGEPDDGSVEIDFDDIVEITDDPPLPHIPSNFGVRQVATKTDAGGNLIEQWVGSRRESDHYEDIRPALPERHIIKGMSTLIDERGNVRAQWIKTGLDKDDEFNALLEALKTLAEPWRGLAEPAPPPEHSNDDLLCVYPMGDPHLGMLAWPAETGNAFDLKIAEDNLFAAVDHLVGLAPPARQALIINLGDFFHSDNKSGTTTRGTQVDVDGRWPKVLSAGIRVMRRLIDRALEKHEHVTVINEIGNHDDHTSIMLSIALAQFYEREPRVTIDTSPQPFHWFRFGSTLIGVHHGDKTKPTNLMGVMACDRAKDWGECEYRYWYIGHVHHDTLKELPGVTVESFRTLAGKDAWHHGQGYRAGRDMKMDVIHRKFGKVNRHIVGIQQLLASSEG